jgi:hypothetical protein
VNRTAARSRRRPAGGVADLVTRSANSSACPKGAPGLAALLYCAAILGADMGAIWAWADRHGKTTATARRSGARLFAAATSWSKTLIHAHAQGVHQLSHGGDGSAIWTGSASTAGLHRTFGELACLPT